MPATLKASSSSPSSRRWRRRSPRRLADAGARVIKVERPEGDFARRYDAYVNGESAYFVWLNRGKESAGLDLKEAGGPALLARMVDKRRRVHPEPRARRHRPPRLRAGRPARAKPASDHLLDLRLRRRGTLPRLKAYDLLVQAESGLSSVTGNAAGPARVGVSVRDIAAGMTAFQGVLQALLGREKTGHGRHVSVSLFHALADWMNVPYLQYVYGGHAPARSGLHHPTIAPYGDYACGDGKSVLFSIQNETEWTIFCREVLGRPDLAADPRFDTNPKRVANRAALDPIIKEAFGAAPRGEIVRRLEAARIAYGRVSTLEDLERHPQNRTVTVETPSGPVRILAPGMVFDEESPDLGPVPAIGAHTAAIRAEFGEPNGR